MKLVVPTHSAFTFDFVQVKNPLENQDFEIMGIGIKVNDEMMTTKGPWDHPRVVCLVVPNLNLDS